MPGDEFQAQRELLVKNWEIVQKIIATLGERSWKVKAWGVTVWWAVVGYATNQKRPELLVYLFIFVGLVFVIDASVRVLEERFLARNQAIERALNAVAARDQASLDDATISTDVDATNLSNIFAILNRKRFGFWLPYLALAILTVMITLFEFLQK